MLYGLDTEKINQNSVYFFEKIKTMFSIIQYSSDEIDIETLLDNLKNISK